MLELAIRGARVVTPAGLREAEIGVEGGRIAEIAPRVGAARGEIAADGLLALPALVDAHVHFNEPGRSDWEGLAHGSAALAAGGGATFCDMPLNSEPPLLTAADFEVKRAAAAAASVADFALWGGLTPANVERLPELAAAGVVGFKAFLCDSGIDSFGAADDGTLWRGMQLAAELDLPLAVHAENDAIVRRESARAAARRERGELSPARAFARGRPLVAELEAVERALLLAGESGCRLHLVHLSSARSVALVARARAEGIDASCETCPHYLVFDEDDLESVGAPLKCAPPPRGAEARAALWTALRRGEIDFVASDHSPAPPDLKRGGFEAAWGGVAGVQSTLAVLLDAAAEGRLDAPRVAELTAAAPARRLRLAGKGALEPGADADVALVDPDARWTLDAAALRQRHPISPYLGRTFRGRVRRTLRRGATIAQDGAVPDDAGRGRLLRPAPHRHSP